MIKLRGVRLAGVAAAFAGGTGGGVQARINGGLGTRLHDGIAAAVISNGTALLLLLVAVLARPANRDGLRRVIGALREGRLRPWECVGGACGALLVASQGLSAGALGVAVFTVAVVTGQSASGLVVDRSGIAPGGRRPVTGARAVGAALTVAAVVLAVAGRLGSPSRLALAVLPLLAGAAIAWQAAVNGRVRQAVGGVFPATMVNAVVGTAALLIAFAISLAVRGWPSGVLPTEPWWYLGGAIGVGFTAVSVTVVRQIGVLLLGLGVIAGQVVGALCIDLVAPGQAGPPTAATVLGAVLTLVAVAIAAAPSAAVTMAAASASSPASGSGEPG
jgi:transporter family-2 protein